MEDTDVEAIVTESAFWHIEASNDNGYHVSQKLELEHEPFKYWPVVIVSNFGHMLNLQWEGSNESFFHDIRSSKFIYPPGYFKFTPPPANDQKSKQQENLESLGNETDASSAPNESGVDPSCAAELAIPCEYTLEPPNGVSLSPADVKSIINRYEKYACIHLDYRKPLSLYTLGGCSSIYFRKGVILEVSLSSDPSKHWFARVIKNVAGRLLLRWCSPSDQDEETPSQEEEVIPANVAVENGSCEEKSVLPATIGEGQGPIPSDVMAQGELAPSEPAASETKIETESMEEDFKKEDERNTEVKEAAASSSTDNASPEEDDSVKPALNSDEDNGKDGQVENGELTSTIDGFKEGDFWLFYCHPRVFKVGSAVNRNNQSDWNLSYEPPVPFENWREYADKFIPTTSDFEDNYSDINYTILKDGEPSLLNYMLSRVKLLRPDLLEDWSKLQISDTVLIFPSNLLKLIPVQVESKVPKLGIRFKSNPLNSNAIDFWYPFDDGNCVLPHSWAEENEIPIDLGCVTSQSDGPNDLETSDASANDKNESIIDLDSWVASSRCKIGSIRLKNNADRINEFESNGKVEIVHPDDSNIICEGIIIRVTPPLIWVQISSERIRILPFNSTEIFPSGWSENNGYTLTRLLPSNGENVDNNDEIEQNGLQKSPSDSPAPVNKDENSQDISSQFTESPMNEVTSKAWCPRIYFNYKCFTGPSLSKSKLCNLPRFVGPGPVLLVMQEVVSKILSIAYVSSRILNELASDTFFKLLEARKITKIEPVYFKAKYNNNTSKTLRLEVPVIRTADKVEEYCHLICSHLKCCFNLFGPKLYDGDNCPSNCRGLTKSNKVLKRTDFFRQQAAAAKMVAEATAEGDEITLPKFVVNLPAVTNKKSNAKSSKRSIDDDDITGYASKRKGKSNKKQKVSQLIEKKDEEEDADEDETKSTTSSGKNENGKETHVANKSSKSRRNNQHADDEAMDALDKENENATVTGKSGSHQKSKASSTPSRKLLPHENPINWSIARVHKFLCDSECSTFAPTFRDHEIDGAALLLLDKETLIENLVSGYTKKYTEKEVVRLASIIFQLRRFTLSHLVHF